MSLANFAQNVFRLFQNKFHTKYLMDQKYEYSWKRDKKKVVCAVVNKSEGFSEITYPRACRPPSGVFAPISQRIQRGPQPVKIRNERLAGCFGFRDARFRVRSGSRQSKFPLWVQKFVQKEIFNFLIRFKFGQLFYFRKAKNTRHLRTLNFVGRHEKNDRWEKIIFRQRRKVTK